MTRLRQGQRETLTVALIEAPASDTLGVPGSGLYRTEDGGASWTKMSDAVAGATYQQGREMVFVALGALAIFARTDCSCQCHFFQGTGPFCLQ